MVLKVAPWSSLNIGKVKSEGIITPVNWLKKACETHGNLENHISPKHKKEFKNFVLKLLFFDNTFLAILEKLLAKSEVRVITIQLHNYNNGFDNKF